MVQANFSSFSLTREEKQLIQNTNMAIERDMQNIYERKGKLL